MALGALDPITASMAGQTVSQAWSSQGMSDPYNVGFGIKDYTSNVPAISGDTTNTVSSSEEIDPIDAFDEYVEDNPNSVSDVSGGVTIGSIVSSLAYSIMETEPEVGVKVVKAVMPVAVPLEEAYVAISQALGVSMDAAEMEVETKQKYANSITQFNDLLYDSASNLVKAWWDGVHILFPKKALDSVYELIREEGWSSDGGMVSELEGNLTQPIPFTSAISSGTYYSTEDHDNAQKYDITVTVSGDNMKALLHPKDRLFFSFTSPGTIMIQGTRTAYHNGQISGTYPLSISLSTSGSYTYDEKTAYYGSGGTGDLFYTAGPPLADGDWYPNNIDGWILQYGRSVGILPEGIEKSNAQSYTPDDIPDGGNLAISSNETIPVVPINLPTNPYNTIDSTVDPTSATNPDDVDNLNPPPIPLPIPDTRPSNPDIPLTNSSVVNAELVDALVEELANTLDPQPEQSSGMIPVPVLPGIPDGQGGSSYPSIVPSSGSGLIHVYNPTPAEFVSFGSWLWVTYADSSIDKIWNNPFDGIIGAFELYATPQTDGTDNIRSGFLVCPTTAALVRQRYIEIDCGSIIVPEFYGNYLDYSPYSQAYIYLPFIGINEVSIDDIVGHAINLRYRIDTYNGSCIAMIYVAKSGYRNLCYQFAGNCAVEVPLAGGSQAAIKAGMMQAEAYARSAMVSAGGHLLGGIGSALMGSLGGAISNIAGIAGDYANAKAGVEAARVANKSSVQHSGQFGASHGAMGNKIPFIIIRNPIQVKVVNYNDDYGFPAHKRVIIGGCTGYLRVREVNVVSAHATDDEKAAIEMMLKNGVYV